LGGTEGHLVGGDVVPSLVALSSVVLTTTSFANPIVEKLSSVAYDQGKHDNTSPY